jgi:hypothetical protein
MSRGDADCRGDGKNGDLSILSATRRSYSGDAAGMHGDLTDDKRRRSSPKRRLLAATEATTAATDSGLLVAAVSGGQEA